MRSVGLARDLGLIAFAPLVDEVTLKSFEVPGLQRVVPAWHPLRKQSALQHNGLEGVDRRNGVAPGEVRGDRRSPEGVTTRTVHQVQIPARVDELRRSGRRRWLGVGLLRANRRFRHFLGSIQREGQEPALVYILKG